MNIILRRCRQFFRALFCKMTFEDYLIVDTYLNDSEKKLFYMMQTPVQKHCVNVAKTLQTVIHDCADFDSKLLIKAALLHDIGKSKADISLFDRVMFVLLKKILPQLARNAAKPGQGNFISRFKYSLYIQLKHEEIGAQIAIDANLENNLVFLIKNHHNKELASSSKELALLIYADEIN